nr:transporter substrate-binding domain-containing protein [Oceanobacter mangrovi]
MVALPVQARPVLNVAICDDFPPFYYRDEDGSLRGASYEIALELAGRLGYDMRVSQFATMRLMLAELESGRQDLAVNLTATPERQQLALFTQTPHLIESHHLIARADNRLEFDGQIGSLSRYRLGLILGWTYGAALDNAAYLDKSYASSSVEQLKSLIAGRFDLAVNNPQFMLYLAHQLGISKSIRVIEPAVFELPVTMAVSRRYPRAEQLRNALEAAIQQFRQEAGYQEILQRYGFSVDSGLADGG